MQPVAACKKAAVAHGVGWVANRSGRDTASGPISRNKIQSTEMSRIPCADDQPETGVRFFNDLMARWQHILRLSNSIVAVWSSVIILGPALHLAMPAYGGQEIG